MSPAASKRADVVSSFTLVKGGLIEESYRVFAAWDFDLSKRQNLDRVRADNSIGAKSATWLRDVTKVLNRRFDPDGRDRPLVRLAQIGCRLSVWRPALLWHMTRDERLLREWITDVLYGAYIGGGVRVSLDDVERYLGTLHDRGIIAQPYSPTTSRRLAGALLTLGAEFGLLSSGLRRSYQAPSVPDESFLYLLHAIAAPNMNAHRVFEQPDWHLFFLNRGDVEREVLRLHQFRRLDYQVAGSVAQLALPYASAADLVEHWSDAFPSAVAA